MGVEGIYFDYDHATDMMYIGINCGGPPPYPFTQTVVICGDADGDGDPGSMAGGSGADFADLNNDETFSLLIDSNLNADGQGAGEFEAVVGVGGLAGIDISTFGIYNYLFGRATGGGIPFGYGAALPNTIVLFANPSPSAPDLEFSIANFSTIPGFGYTPGDSFLFRIHLLAGATSDVIVTEEVMPDALSVMTVTDDLDPGLTFIPASTQIAFQATGPITPGIYDNFALAEGTHPGGIVTDTASVTLLVEDPSVALDKTLNSPGVVGDLVTFTIHIENTGPSTIDVLPLYDTFSGPIIYHGGDPIADVIDNINQELLWNDLTISFGQDLHPGQDFYIITVFQLTNPTTYTVINTAQIPPGGADVYNNPINQPLDETAVKLIDFRANQKGQDVLLSWETAIEIDTYGFRILRDDASMLNSAVEIAFISSQAFGYAGGASYEYLDDTVAAGQTYTYWLMDVDVNGIETLNGPAEITVSGSLSVYLPMILR